MQSRSRKLFFLPTFGNQFKCKDTICKYINKYSFECQKCLYENKVKSKMKRKVSQYQH